MHHVNDKMKMHESYIEMFSNIYIFTKKSMILSPINNFLTLPFACAALSILPELIAITTPIIINIQYISIIVTPRITNNPCLTF